MATPGNAPGAWCSHTERARQPRPPDHPERARLAPGYAPGEYHLPYDYAPRPDSLARAWFADAEVARSLDHLATAQQSDGGWPINWAQWSPTVEAEARPGVTLKALLTLRVYGRLSGSTAE